MTFTEVFGTFHVILYTTVGIVFIVKALIKGFELDKSWASFNLKKEVD